MKNAAGIALCAVSLCLTSVSFGQQAVPTAPIRVWNCDIHDSGYGTPDSGPPAIFIVSCRNGANSGKVVVGSDALIQGLKATAGDLRGPSGSVIPSASVQVRYGVEWDGGIATSWGGIKGPDILLESPLETFPAASGGRCLVPVWVTVRVPNTANAGTYAGTLSIEAKGSPPVTVPVTVQVQDWTLPDSQNFRVWTEVIEQPETLSAEYNLTPWSEKHWQMIEKSFRLIRPTGSRVLYIPLISRTNYGSEETMVKWVKKPDGSYDYDFSLMERYLDTAVRTLGKPKIVGFIVWDVYLTALTQSSATAPAVEVKGNPGSYEWRESMFAKLLAERQGMGPVVTAFDPQTKQMEPLILPRYDDPKSTQLWQPLWDGVKSRMKSRGLEDAMMLAQLSDRRPTKAEIAFWDRVTGGVEWMSCSHHAWQWLSDTQVTKKQMDGIGTIGYTACALDFQYVLNPEKDEKERRYGWKKPMLHGLYWRFGTLNSSSLPWIRHELECNITGNQRGLAHIGGDFWPCFKNAAGKRTGTVTDRFPESYWHSLNVGSWLLAPGPDGPVGTVRLEVLREGIQECEARIAIEDVLTDPARRAKLGEDLAKRAQQLLDERQRNIWRSRGAQEDDFQKYGLVAQYRTMIYDLAGREGKWKNTAGPALQDYIKTAKWRDWQSGLFSVAGEVARKLGD